MYARVCARASAANTPYTHTHTLQTVSRALRTTQTPSTVPLLASLDRFPNVVLTLLAVSTTVLNCLWCLCTQRVACVTCPCPTSHPATPTSGLFSTMVFRLAMKRTPRCNTDSTHGMKLSRQHKTPVAWCEHIRSCSCGTVYLSWLRGHKLPCQLLPAFLTYPFCSCVGCAGLC